MAEIIRHRVSKIQLARQELVRTVKSPQVALIKMTTRLAENWREGTTHKIDNSSK
jgi:hypothetical protein